MKILTIVIPAYNIEKYADMCLGSFVVEEVLKDIEVLIINDGSSDKTEEIALSYQDKYPDTFRLITKKNGGHGSTINTGIKEASGKYFKVVDGDDWVLKDGLINLVNNLKEVDSDLVMSNYYWVDDKTKKTKPEMKEPFKKVEYKKEYAFSDIYDVLYAKMHAVTFKTKILKSYNPKIDEHCFYVDMEYVIFPIPHISTVYFIEDYVYMYRVGLKSQSMNIKGMQKNEENYDRVFKRLLAFYDLQKKKEIKGHYLYYIEGILARMVSSRYKIYLSFPISSDIKHKMKLFDKDLKKNYPQIHEKVKNKAVLFLRAMGFNFYSLARFMFFIKSKI